MFKKAIVRLEDGFAYGKTGWVVIVLIGDTFGWPDKTAALHFTTRSEAVKVYTLMSNVIKALE